jgi:DNA-binding transcriptional regulator/RsmH inhibitor MraZ
LGVERLSADAKARIHVPGSIASYLRQSEDKSALGLFMTTLDGIEAIVWPRAEYLHWVAYLEERAGASEADRRGCEHYLRTAQLCGGESELGRDSRCVLPRALREALRLPQQEMEFGVYVQKFVRLIPAERLSEVQQRLFSRNEEVLDFTDRHAAAFLRRRRRGSE